jgi:ABC-type multidrug transport system fused ATPase/permease subunit
LRTYTIPTYTDETQMIKKISSKYLSHFSFFYRFLGVKIFVALALSVLVGVLDGFGLTMFLPLLEAVDHPGEIDTSVLGNLSFVVDVINGLGISLTILVVLSLLISFFILKGIAQYIQGFYVVTVQQFFLRNLRLNLLQLLNGIAFKKYITTDIGRIQNALTVEIERLSNAYKGFFESMKSGVLVVVYMSFAFLVNPKFAILVMIGGGLTNFLYRAVYMRTKQVSRSLTVDMNFFQGQIIQYMTNFKYLKATGQLNQYSQKLNQQIDHIEKNNKEIGRLTTVLGATREPMLIVVVSVILYLQVTYFGGKIGSLLVSLLFFYRALTAVMIMQSQWNFFLTMSGSMENVDSLLKELKPHQEVENKGAEKHLESAINVKEGAFSYDLQSYQLTDIHLQINKNETVAFVGESGSGKTTLVNVLVGLLPLTKGSYMVDNQDFYKIDKSFFQQRVGYITQEPVIFSDTIYNNVTFWAPKTTENLQRFQQVLVQSSLKKFVEELPNKEDSELGNNGVNISGGQKQRISIARELFKEIDLLVMDEATSALDSETELAIKESIDALKGKYTILIIAHRLSTVRNANQVVLMHQGKIEQKGTFEELVSSNEKFKKMVELQEI